MEDIFDQSYFELSTPEAVLYRMCSLHPGAVFGAEAAAAAVDLPVEDVETSLHVLVDRNLITEVADRRFRYHNLLLLHARRQSERCDPEPARRAALRRILEWYLDRAVDADLVVRPTRHHVGPRYHQDRARWVTTHKRALEWFTEERRNLRFAVQSAHEHGWDALTWQFCEALWSSFLHITVYSDWLEIHALGIPAARREGHHIAEARLRAQLCYALNGLRRYDDAIREGQVALDLAVQENDESTKATALGELAGALQGIGDLSGALTCLQEARQIRLVIGTDRAAAVLQRRIGEVLDALGRSDEAADQIGAAVAALSTVDPAQHSAALTSLGSLFFRAGRASEAEPLLTEALDIARELGFPHYQASALLTLGDIAWHRNNATDAARQWTAALQIYAAGGSPKATDVAARLNRVPSETTVDHDCDPQP